MSEAISESPRLRPNRPALAAVAAVGCFLGLSPYVRFLGRWDLIAILIGAAFTASALFVAFSSLSKRPSEASEAPNLGEWLLGGCVAAGTGAVGSLIGFVCYGVGFGLIKLWNLLAASQGPPRANADVWGLWLSLPVTFAMGLAFVSMATEKLEWTLYTSTAGARSVYFPLTSQISKLLAISVTIASALVIVVWLPPNVVWMAVATLCLLFVFYPLDNLSGDPPSEGQIAVVDAVERLFQEAGYKVVRSPRTGKADVDPLIRNVTLLASAGNESFALEMKDASRDNEPVPWNAAASVRTASTVLAAELSVKHSEAASVRPILVVVGGSVGSSLRRFSELEGVPVVHLKRERGSGIFRTEIVQKAELKVSFEKIGIPISAGASKQPTHPNA